MCIQRRLNVISSYNSSFWPSPWGQKKQSKCTYNSVGELAWKQGYIIICTTTGFYHTFFPKRLYNVRQEARQGKANKSTTHIMTQRERHHLAIMWALKAPNMRWWWALPEKPVGTCSERFCCWSSSETSVGRWHWYCTCVERKTLLFT